MVAATARRGPRMNSPSIRFAQCRPRVTNSDRSTGTMTPTRRRPRRMARCTTMARGFARRSDRRSREAGPHRVMVRYGRPRLRSRGAAQLLGYSFEPLFGPRRLLDLGARRRCTSHRAHRSSRWLTARHVFTDGGPAPTRARTIHHATEEASSAANGGAVGDASHRAWHARAFRVTRRLRGDGHGKRAVGTRFALALDHVLRRSP